jgi:hypothetical protein
MSELPYRIYQYGDVIAAFTNQYSASEFAMEYSRKFARTVSVEYHEYGNHTPRLIAQYIPGNGAIYGPRKQAH